MAALSQTYQTNILTHSFLTASWTKPTTLAVALVTSAVTNTQTGATVTECSNANGYVRQAVNPSNSNWSISTVSGYIVATNVNAITFPVATGSGWGTVVGIALVDSATYGSGNVVVFGSIASQTVAVNNQVVFNAGSITFQIQ